MSTYFYRKLKINSNVNDVLSILVYPDQVIVQWIGVIHNHFDALIGNGAVGYMEAAVDYIEQIVTDLAEGP